MHAIRFVFVSTSFGFGPVSKAVTIARELAGTFPGCVIHFYGAGTAHDFARHSQVFSALFERDVDDPETLQACVIELKQYAVVISVLNFEIAKLWRRDIAPPLVVIDSLAWMWHERPKGLENVAAYFVQDYLIGPQGVPLHPTDVVVPPIDASVGIERTRHPNNRLLVNLSGCSNPLVASALYDDYTDIIVDEVIANAGHRFDSTLVCCNTRQATRLHARHGMRVSAAHLSHLDFINEMASAAMFFTSPGITTTIEALSLEIPLRFLLPQNYSQALIAQFYSDHGHDDACVALHHFGDEYRVPAGMPESVGVAHVLASITEILEFHRRSLRQAVSRLGSAPPIDSVALRKYVSKRWSRTGQSIIVDHVTALLVGTVRDKRSI